MSSRQLTVIPRGPKALAWHLLVGIGIFVGPAAQGMVPEPVQRVGEDTPGEDLPDDEDFWHRIHAHLPHLRYLLGNLYWVRTGHVAADDLPPPDSLNLDAELLQFLNDYAEHGLRADLTLDDAQKGRTTVSAVMVTLDQFPGGMSPPLESQFRAVLTEIDDQLIAFIP